MVGLFNTIGHETEPNSREMSAQLHDQLSRIHTLLGQYEVQAAYDDFDGIAEDLFNVADQFMSLAGGAAPYRLSDVNQGVPVAAEMESLANRLEQLDISRPILNDDLLRIAAVETARLAQILRSSRLAGRHSDWHNIRDILLAVNRLNEVGIIVSRMSALQGDDPLLRY